jgi:hypothetical protein
MQGFTVLYRDQIREEVVQTPDEYLPMLLQLVRIFRESVALKPAEESLRQGWKEAMAGETLPIEELWRGIDAE